MSRLIDADALVEKYGNYYTEEGTEEGFIGTLKSLIDEQPTIGGWISVEDRLPKLGMKTLIYYNGKAAVGKYIANGKWIMPAFFGEPTHWAMLPKEPEQIS